MLKGRKYMFSVPGKVDKNHSRNGKSPEGIKADKTTDEFSAAVMLDDFRCKLETKFTCFFLISLYMKNGFSLIIAATLIILLTAVPVFHPIRLTTCPSNGNCTVILLTKAVSATRHLFS
jgi:hypothetical protein